MSAAVRTENSRCLLPGDRSMSTVLPPCAVVAQDISLYCVKVSVRETVLLHLQRAITDGQIDMGLLIKENVGVFDFDGMTPTQPTAESV